MERPADRAAIIRLAQRRARRRLEALLEPGRLSDVSAISELLRSDDDQVRFAAIVQIGSLGPLAGPALPALTALSDREACADNISMLRWAIQAVQGRKPSCASAPRVSP